MEEYNKSEINFLFKKRTDPQYLTKDTTRDICKNEIKLDLYKQNIDGGWYIYCNPDAKTEEEKHRINNLIPLSYKSDINNPSVKKYLILYKKTLYKTSELILDKQT